MFVLIGLGSQYRTIHICRIERNAVLGPILWGQVQRFYIADHTGVGSVLLILPAIHLVPIADTGKDDICGHEQNSAQNNTGDHQHMQIAPIRFSRISAVHLPAKPFRQTNCFAQHYTACL